MKSLLLPLAITAIICLGLGFFIGKNSAANNASSSTNKLSTAMNPADSPKADTTLTSDPVTPSEPVDSSSPPQTTVTLPTTTGHTNEATADNGSGLSDYRLSILLEAIAKNIEAKRLKYDSKLGQDCSGIFHQLKDSLIARIPRLQAEDQYTFPQMKTVRVTRQIADWYFRNNNLQLIQDPIAARNSIRPGAVMFFSKPDRKYSNLTIQMLTDRDNNYSSNGAIMHVAVVTTVEKDDNGDVVGYTMMHGRNSKIHASRSGSALEQVSRSRNDLPAFGNWSQQWVAVANIITPNS